MAGNKGKRYWDSEHCEQLEMWKTGHHARDCTSLAIVGGTWFAQQRDEQQSEPETASTIAGLWLCSLGGQANASIPLLRTGTFGVDSGAEVTAISPATASDYPREHGRKEALRDCTGKPVEDMVRSIFSAQMTSWNTENVGCTSVEDHVASCSVGGNVTRSHVQERSIVRVASRNWTVAIHPQSPRNERDGFRTGVVCDGTKNLEVKGTTRSPNEYRSAETRA